MLQNKVSDKFFALPTQIERISLKNIIHSLLYFLINHGIKEEFYKNFYQNNEDEDLTVILTTRGHMHANKKYMIMEWKFGNEGVIDIFKISFELLTSVNVYGTSQLTP